MFQSAAPGAPPDDPVRGFGPCSCPPRMLQSGASFCRILSVASDDPVRGPGFPPGRSSPGDCAVLHSAPDAPIRGVFLWYSLRCLGRSSPWHRVLPRTIQSGGLGRAALRPGCSNPGRLLVVFSPLPRTLQSVAPGSPPDDPVRGLVPCFIPPRMLQSGASFFRILSVASDAPVRGTRFSPGRSSPGAWAVLHSAPDAPIRGVFMSYSLCCLGRSSPWHRVHPQTIQSGGSGRAALRPGCSNPGRHVSSSLCCLRLTNPTARALASWRAVLWGRHERPGGAPLAWVWGVRGRALSHPRPLVLSGVRPGPASRWPWVRCAGVGARLSLAPCRVPRFVVCCARFPGSRHPAAVVAWHLSLCRGCGRRRASLACLMAPRWCAAPRPVRLLSVLRSAFPSPWCLPPPRGRQPGGFTGWLRGARGGRPRTRLIVPAAGPCRGKGAGRAPRRTRSGPRDGVVPGGSLRLRFWAACAAVVPGVWTWSLTHPVSRTVRLLTGDSAGAPGLFRVDANTAPFRVRGRHARVPRLCVCVLFLARSGGLASRARFGAPHLSFGRSWCALCLFRPLRAGVAPFVVGVGFFFFSFPFLLPPPCCAPVVSCFACFPAPGALGLGVLSPPAPPPFFFPSPPLSPGATPLSRRTRSTHPTGGLSPVDEA